MTTRRSSAAGTRPSSAILLALILSLASCSSPTETPTSGQPTSVATASPPSASSGAACTSGSATTPPAPPGVISSGVLWTVATGLDQPDDLLWPNGSLLIGIMGRGTIEELAPEGVSTLPFHVDGLEGIAAIGTKLYVAGQAQDAVFEWLGGTDLRRVIQLEPVAGQPGVDGIAAVGGVLVVPDSPRGVVDWVDPASGHIERQVGGFTRPTGAWPERDGSLLVADEFGDAVFRVASDGHRTSLARDLPSADDVAEDSLGNVFAVTASTPDGRLVQLVNGSATTLADRVQGGQGLAVDDADNLYVSEAAVGRVDLLIRTFKLVPPGPVTPSATQPLCIDIQRAAGFTAPVALQGSAGVTVAQQPGSGDRATILLTGCSPVSPCDVTASSGTLRDVLRVAPSP